MFCGVVCHPIRKLHAQNVDFPKINILVKRARERENEEKSR